MYRAYNDPLGEPVVLEDGLGRQTRFEADAAGRVTRVIYPDGTSAAYAYDAEGNLVRATDETGLVTEYRYDGNSSLLEQVEPDGAVLRFGYDTEENLVSVTNYRGERTESVYDAVGHEVRITYFDGRVEAYDYDERDNVVVLRDGAGRVLARYEYDDASRLVLIRWADGTETRITYGDQCQILAIDGPDASIQYEWDAEMRIVRETVNGAALDYEYDASGNRIAVTTSAGRRITYEWDLRGRLTGMTDSGRHAYRYEYNAVDLVTAAFLPNGLGQRFEYDALSRMRRRQVVGLSGGATIADRTFDYDAGDRLVRSEDLQRGLSTYRYDATEHLLEAVTPAEIERYEYDAAENLVLTRSGLRAAVAAGDRVTSLGPAETYRYDADGNLTERSVGDAVTRYAYDAQGQLIHVTDPAGEITEYRYDPLGRRISKSRGRVETRFEWDGVALLRETAPGGDIDYLFLPQSFLPAGLTRRDGPLLLRLRPDRHPQRALRPHRRHRLVRRLQRLWRGPAPARVQRRPAAPLSGPVLRRGAGALLQPPPVLRPGPRPLPHPRPHRVRRRRQPVSLRAQPDQLGRPVRARTLLGAVQVLVEQRAAEGGAEEGPGHEQATREREEDPQQRARRLRQPEERQEDLRGMPQEPRPPEAEGDIEQVLQRAGGPHPGGLRRGLRDKILQPPAAQPERQRELRRPDEKVCQGHRRPDAHEDQGEAGLPAGRQEVPGRLIESREGGDTMTSEQMGALVPRIAEILTATYKLEHHGAGVNRSILHPPVPPKDIASFEQKHDLRFPPSYRQFLELHNGWEHFWLNMTLIGVSGKHTKAVLDEVKEAIEWQNEDLATEMDELTPKNLQTWEKQDESNLFLAHHVPFAASFAGEFLVFDRSTVKRNGEMQVVFWNMGSGADEDERHEDFAELLESVAKRVEAHHNKITKSKGAKAKKK